MWDVTTRTRTGSCEPTAHYAITVGDGKVSGLANVSGTVSRSGNVRVAIGGAYAKASLRVAPGPENGTLLQAEPHAAAGGRRRKSEARPRCRFSPAPKPQAAPWGRSRNSAFVGRACRHLEFRVLGSGRSTCAVRSGRVGHRRGLRPAASDPRSSRERAPDRR